MEQSSARQSPQAREPSLKTASSQITNEEELATVFDLLEDEAGRAILSVVKDHPLSAQELADQCGLPPSTTYRKVALLTDVGLLETELDISGGGKPTTLYHSHIDSITVSLSETGLEARVFETQH